MKKYQSYERKDPDKVCREIKEGMGIPHPERVVGFFGLLFSPGDVYISDHVDFLLQSRPGFDAFLKDSLQRFVNDDYGDISEWDREDNIELKWLGPGIGLFARYCFEDADWEYKAVTVKIRTLEHYTYIALEGELDPLMDSRPAGGN